MVPGFNVDEPDGCADHCVQFTDQTPGAVSWDWTLGDGSTSAANAPQHCYGAGTFDVSLTVTDANGC
ncbi:MAG: PKD domain-containing protein, partial [Flavobacteriales bacterium]|nr:PKD domain-containing protein [Flavobacteriales bacterium]